MRSEVGLFVFSTALLCSRCLSTCSDQAVCASQGMPAAGLLQMIAENAKASKVSTEEGLRCCCHLQFLGDSSSSMEKNPEYQKKLHPNSICVGQNDTSKVYSISQSPSIGGFEGAEIHEWHTSVEITRRGAKCSGTSCTSGHIKKHMFQYTEFDNLTKYDDAGLFVLGSGLYKRSEATYQECRNEVCSTEHERVCECRHLLLGQTNVSAVSGSRRRRRKSHDSHDECERHCTDRCHDKKTCGSKVTAYYCGHTADRGLVHYKKVGNVGECIPEKVCPSGMFHESRADQGSSMPEDSKNAVCRCAGCE